MLSVARAKYDTESPGATFSSSEIERARPRLRAALARVHGSRLFRSAVHRVDEIELPYAEVVVGAGFDSELFDR